MTGHWDGGICTWSYKNAKKPDERQVPHCKYVFLILLYLVRYLVTFHLIIVGHESSGQDMNPLFIHVNPYSSFIAS